MVNRMRIHVTVVYSAVPRQVHEIHLELPDSSSVLQALQVSGLLQRFPELDLGLCTVGIWGRKASPNQILRDQDRVEIYRALKVDPKVARRERFARQGAKTTGLFAKKRAGAKAGY